ncbi:hypothetical protein PPL_04220 [Heterostelium album PN500]|uniref:Uncharacterized protein n=1 Tax=Heterostelium pallidum (strain ATCC 26659 / Pp 5 / PN500) TaxID=670386 RepID=D3B6Y9_HETP5|nr:hypothetical protein PPL_04220 [Heterostelium album PN500]EFA82532.1 hypothetical protein PPL_04220 [Heterostelium album PN500]|eukprot:XP_020434649.1 hypothetical protein PPL_04220 [Heterostelium album PN500]
MEGGANTKFVWNDELLQELARIKQLTQTKYGMKRWREKAMNMWNQNTNLPPLSNKRQITSVFNRANKKEKLREVGLAVQPTSKAAKTVKTLTRRVPTPTRDNAFTFAMGRLADQIHCMRQPQQHCVEAKIKSLQALKTGYIDYIKKIREEAKFRYINEMMLKDEGKAYSLITGKRTTTNNQNNTQQQEIQTTTRAFEFWSQLWNPPSTEATNYDELEWIQRVKDSNQFKNIKETKFEIEGADISNYIKNKKNWSAPGPDGICNYWIKRIKRYHKDLAEAFKYLHLDIMEFPKWFCEGITYRIHKGGDKEDEANYRPITCINNTCKILTGIVAKHLHQHTKVNNQLMEEVQRGGMTDVWGTYENLFIDNLFCEKYPDINGGMDRPYQSI